MITITQRNIGTVLIVAIAGSIAKTEDNAIRKMRQFFNSVRYLKVLLNLSGMTNFSLEAQGELVFASRAAKEDGGKIELLSPSEAVVRRLTEGRLLQYFPVHDNEEEGIKALNV